MSLCPFVLNEMEKQYIFVKQAVASPTIFNIISYMPQFQFISFKFVQNLFNAKETSVITVGQLNTKTISGLEPLKSTTM